MKTCEIFSQAQRTLYGEKRSGVPVMVPQKRSVSHRVVPIDNSIVYRRESEISLLADAFDDINTIISLFSH